MILKCDAKQLEWRTYLELSRDAVGIQEVLANVDTHSDNQKRFNLPSRLIAKVFLFRWIYRGPAYSYSVDPDFSGVSDSKDFWQGVIDRANSKYQVLYDFQNQVIHRAKQGQVIRVEPTGRTYKFSPKTTKRGELYYSEPDITNYINQGFAADVMSVVRKLIITRCHNANVDFGSRTQLINTVHDDIQLDVDNDTELLYNVCITLENAFKELHEEFYQLFNYELMVPFEGEVFFGPNARDLTKFHKKEGIAQYAA